MSDKDSKSNPGTEIGVDKLKDDNDNAMQDAVLRARLTELQQSFEGFSSMQPPSAARIGKETGRLYDMYNDLRTLSRELFDVVGQLSDRHQSVEAAEERARKAEGEAEEDRKARKVAVANLAELEDEATGLRTEVETLKDELKKSEAEKTELGKELVNSKPFYLTFAYVMTVITAMLEHGNTNESGSDPLRRIETKELISGRVLTAQNKTTQIRLVDEKDRRVLKIRLLNQVTGKPTTMWVDVVIKFAESLSRENILLIAGVLEIPQDSLPADVLDNYRLAPKMLGEVAINAVGLTLGEGKSYRSIGGNLNKM